MTLMEKIKAFRLIGKSVILRNVEMPDDVSILIWVSIDGECKLSNGQYCHISRIKKF